MEKGFRDIEEYFLSVESKTVKPEKTHIKPKRKIDFNKKITALNEKLKGKDRKIKELFQEIGKLREEIENLKKENSSLSQLKESKKIIENYENEIKNLKEEIATLKTELSEKEKKLKSYESAELPKSRIELFIEVALNSITANIATKTGKKILFSKRFRKDIAKEVACRPFLFESFMSAIARIDTTSKLLKRDKHEIYRLRVTSPFGEFRAIYTILDKETLKFQRFGQRDSIYNELDACGWSFE